MDNDIYDQIADYQEWVHLQRPAGGASEMKKLKGGKMKDNIKELKKEALEKLGEQENPEPWFSPKEVLDIIAEIELLETEIKQLQAKIEKLRVVMREVLVMSRTPLRKGLSEAMNILIDIQRKLHQVLAAKDK